MSKKTTKGNIHWIFPFVVFLEKNTDPFKGYSTYKIPFLTGYIALFLFQFIHFFLHLIKAGV